MILAKVLTTYSHTKTVLPMRKSVPRSSRQSDHTKTSWRKLQWYGHVSRSADLAKTILQGTVKGKKKTKQTEEEVGRQHQEMNRPGVRQVPESFGEQGEMEETDREIISGAPTTLAIKKLMMMMMTKSCQHEVFISKFLMLMYCHFPQVPS